MGWVRAAVAWLASSSSAVEPPPPTSAATSPPDPAAGWRQAINNIQATARWLVAAFAAIGALLAAGSQLSDLGAAEGQRLAVALAGVAFAVAGVGLAIWSLSDVIAPRPPVTTGDLVRLAERNAAFAELLRTSPELLQEQADSVADLHARLIEARKQRYAAESTMATRRHDAEAAAAFAAADRRVQDLRTVAGQLRPIAAYLETRHGFRRARSVAFVGAILVASGTVAFAYATHPPDDTSEPVGVVAPKPVNATVHLSAEGERRLRTMLGPTCPRDVPAVVLDGDPTAYDVVTFAPCSSTRFMLTPALGSVTPSDTVQLSPQ